MILDGHIHMNSDEKIYKNLKSKFNEAGIDGGVILSRNPSSFSETPDNSVSRISSVINLCKQDKNMFPFYWIDPMEKDAFKQIDIAVDMGISGFKVICNSFYPGDSKAMEIFTAIAEKNKPIIFHSGILWDGKVSSRYNKPSEFEVLLTIQNLKFTLAHVSWPWYDECIAVYGKFLNAYSEREDLSVEMFIDLTPGTPEIYREEVLTKLFKIGYDIENNIIFGTDCHTDTYNIKWTKEWIERDNRIYSKINLDKETIKNIYSENLLRFVGISKNAVNRKKLLVAE